MSVEIIDNKALWDQLIEESVNSTIFHKWDYLRIMEKYTGDRLLTYAVYRGDELLSAIPLFFSKHSGLKMLYSPPRNSLVYVPYLGFVTGPAMMELKPHEREIAWTFVAEEIGSEVSRISPNYVSLGLSPGFTDVRPFAWNGFQTELRYTYIIDLEQSADAIWESIEKDCRKNIKSASKHSLTLEQVHDPYRFIQIMRQGLKKQGTTFFHRQSPEYIKDVLEAYPDNIKMYFLYDGDDIIGANTLCGFHRHCIGWMGNTAVDSGVSANEYLLWEVIKMAKQEGFKTFENTGADEKRLNLSKTKFNPSLVPFFYVYRRDAIYRTAKYSLDRLGKILA
jgi:hypothetical protein